MEQHGKDLVGKKKKWQTSEKKKKTHKKIGSAKSGAAKQPGYSVNKKIRGSKKITEKESVKNERQPLRVFQYW